MHNAAVLALPWLDRAIDRCAMWGEDRVPRAATGYRACEPAPLACFAPLAPVAAPPAPRAGAWALAGPGGPADPIRVLVEPAAGERRGTAVLVPPWKIRSAGVVSGWSRALAAAGREVWLHVPPHHLERSRGARSGEGFVSTDLRALRASVEQVVTEIRILVAAARARDPGPIAVVGLSLGALAAALAATAPDAAPEAVLVAPPAIDVALARTPIGARYRDLAARAGAPLPAPEALAPLLAPFSPATRRPRARRVLLAAGRHDAIVPPEAPLALARAWGVEPLLYPRGHLTLLFACRALRRDVARFLRG